MSFTMTGSSPTYSASSGGGLSNTVGSLWDWTKGLFGEVEIQTEKGSVSVGKDGISAKVDTRGSTVSMNTGSAGGVYVEQIKNASKKETTASGTTAKPSSDLAVLGGLAAAAYYFLR